MAVPFEVFPLALPHVVIDDVMQVRPLSLLIIIAPTLRFSDFYSV
jgi:hypothetical protein